MGCEIAEPVAPFSLRIGIGLTKSFIVLSYDSLTSVTFFNYRFKKTLHDIQLLLNYLNQLIMPLLSSIVSNIKIPKH